MKKKFLYLLFIITLIVVSCKKDNTAHQATGGNKGVYQVGFTINGFKQSRQPLSSGLRIEHALPGINYDTIAVLYQLIYNADGNLVKYARQLHTDPGFGNFTDSLASGSYTVVFLQSSGVIQGGLRDSTTLAGCTLIKNPNQSLQLYEKKLALTVNTADSDNTVVLDRVVGQLQIVLADTIPQNVSTITMSVDSVQAIFSVANQAVTGTSLMPADLERYYRLTDAQKGVPNFTIGPIYLLQTTPLAVTITAMDASGNTLASVRTHVTLAYNQITILKGSLFGKTGGESTNLKFDPGWNPTPINFSF